MNLIKLVTGHKAELKSKKSQFSSKSINNNISIHYTQVSL